MAGGGRGQTSPRGRPAREQPRLLMVALLVGTACTAPLPAPTPVPATAGPARTQLLATPMLPPTTHAPGAPMASARERPGQAAAEGAGAPAATAPPATNAAASL